MEKMYLTAFEESGCFKNKYDITKHKRYKELADLIRIMRLMSKSLHTDW